MGQHMSRVEKTNMDRVQEENYDKQLRDLEKSLNTVYREQDYASEPRSDNDPPAEKNAEDHEESSSK